MPAQEKTCQKCGQSRSTTHYDKDSRCNDGYRNVCRICRNNQRKARYAERFPPGVRRPRNHKQEAEYARGKRRRHIAKYLIGGAKKRAKKKGLSFNLEDYREEIITRAEPMRCELSGIPLKMADGARDYDSISLDRMDPDYGYTIENVRIVCWAINAAAGTWGLKKALEIMRKVEG